MHNAIFEEGGEARIKKEACRLAGIKVAPQNGERLFESALCYCINTVGKRTIAHNMENALALALAQLYIAAALRPISTQNRGDRAITYNTAEKAKLDRALAP